MNVIVKPVPVGDMAGSLAYFVTSDGDLGIRETLTTITSNTLAEPRLVVIDGRHFTETEALEMTTTLRQAGYTVAIVVDTNIPSRVWYAANRVVLVTELVNYFGVPAQELHLVWNPDYDDGPSNHPVVAPLGAQQTHVYCTTGKGNFPALIEWARRAPYPIGIIPRTL